MPLPALLTKLLSLPPGPFDPTWNAPQRGAWGEEWAAWHYYHKRGAAVLSRNWRGGGGELDLVVREGETLVFVEVKTRNPDDPEPLAAVRDPKRMRHLRSASLAYLRTLPTPRPATRIDVILITPDPANPKKPHVNLVLDAFALSDPVEPTPGA